jgi:uncharacterized membrane protein
MFADISSGHTGGAGVLFLLALVLAVLAVVAAVVARPRVSWAAPLGWFAVAALAAAFLVL